MSRTPRTSVFPRGSPLKATTSTPVSSRRDPNSTVFSSSAAPSTGAGGAAAGGGGGGGARPVVPSLSLPGRDREREYQRQGTPSDDGSDVKSQKSSGTPAPRNVVAQSSATFTRATATPRATPMFQATPSSPQPTTTPTTPTTLEGELSPDDRVRVAVRVRPPNATDQIGKETVCVECASDLNSLRMDGTSSNRGSKNFAFDHVFDAKSSQEQVYQAVGGKMLEDALKGYNTTIFAYGQTGSGKTYSMIGGEEEHEWGLLPKLANNLFLNLEEMQTQDPTLTVKVQFSFLEIYNEKVRDLLSKLPNGVTPKDVQDARYELPELRVVEENRSSGASTARGRSVTTMCVKDLSWHPVLNPARILKFIRDGSAIRQRDSTQMNEISSRSHGIIQIQVSQTHEPPSALVKDKESRITIVDLAGSERIAKTGSIDDSKKLKEAERINMSLLVLGRCLNSFSDKDSRHTPVRDSVLTRILADIFGGNSKAIMLATIGPSSFNYTESMSTLEYALNAKKIKHNARVNNLARALEVKELKEQVKQLGQTLVTELEKAEQTKKELRRMLEERDREIESLNAQLAEKDALLKSGGGGGGGGGGGASGGRKSAGPDAFSPPQPQHSRRPSDFMATASADFDIPLASSRRSHDMAPVSHDEIVSLEGHSAAVYCCAFSPNGDRLLSGARDRTLKLWTGAPTISKATELITFRGHSGFVLSCAFSPTGTEVASGSDDKTIRLWDCTTGEKICILRGHSDKVYSVAFSAPRGSELVSASCDRTVKVWSTQSGKKLVTLRGHTSSVFYAVFSGSDGGQRVLSAGDDRTLRLWNWRNTEELGVFYGHSGTVWACAFSPDDRWVASASMDQTVKIWETATFLSMKTLRGHTGPVHHLTFVTLPVENDAKRSQSHFYDADSGKMLAVCSAARDRTIKLWDPSTGECVRTLYGHSNTVYHLSVAPATITDVKSRPFVLSCSSDDTLKVWQL